ncbi:hypothetical protein L1987_67374 [Smallanthus sonchifolius]|uniref:Uncharacterized protein n=2 Tax=Smallanthus sonchifolius TaxID=185202 RepID=A0ACB9B309_9ASTR|nr:hypothetical protein L1987_67369 [Smallanthus sonchifolius]KAI3716473.1 hypothetical protein L1987_67374 [Smallanthus sonchifolius]
MAEVVHTDLVEQILIRLDVEDLIRCKSVCKSWYSLITSMGFINRHMNHSCDKDPYMYSDKLDHRRIILVNGNPSRLYNDHHLVGSSNDLVCISAFSSKLLVGNPLTREVRQLELPPWISLPLCWGFGYDSSKDDYNVIVGSAKDENMKKLIVSYDLSKERFTEIPQPSDSRYKTRRGALLSTAYHLGLLQNSTSHSKRSAIHCLPSLTHYICSEIRHSEATMASSMVRRLKLGSQGLVVSAQGLGCMGMSMYYGPPKPEPDMIKLIRHAVDSGVTFIDTSDFYGPHTNEILIGKALKGGYREKVQIATKFGIRMIDGKADIRGDPGIDNRVPIEVTVCLLLFLCVTTLMSITKGIPSMGELKKLVEEGKVKYVGLSEACVSTIRRAHAVHPITAIQPEWSLWTRDVEKEIVPTCRELGIGIVTYAPLGKGFLANGLKLAERLTERDFRKTNPRFENAEHNKIVFERINEMATRKGCTAAQLALSWVHHQGTDVVPIPGTTKIENLNQNIGALSVQLTPAEMVELESYASSDVVKGDRYASTHYTWENSDTPPLSSWKGI